jgi:hypothetical protein
MEARVNIAQFAMRNRREYAASNRVRRNRSASGAQANFKAAASAESTILPPFTNFVESMPATSKDGVAEEGG